MCVCVRACVRVCVRIGLTLLLKSVFLLAAVAMKPKEVQEALQLTKLKDRTWYIQPSCATSGDGLHEGLAWLSFTHSRKKR